MRNPVKTLVNPLEMLASDHETVKVLFAQCEQADPGMKRHLLSQEIFKNLEIHATLEEEIFYPAVQEHVNYEEGAVVREAYREHQQIKNLMRELKTMGQEDAAFTNRLGMLRERVLAHADKEENQIFPLAERTLSLNTVAFAMDKRRIQLMVQKPAPSLLGMVALGFVGMGLVMVMLRRRQKG